MKLPYKGAETEVEPTSRNGTAYVFTFEGITPWSPKEKGKAERIVHQAVADTQEYRVENYGKDAPKQDVSLTSHYLTAK